MPHEQRVLIEKGIVNISRLDSNAGMLLLLLLLLLLFVSTVIDKVILLWNHNISFRFIIGLNLFNKSLLLH